jgi:hypothetical protein
MDGLFVTDQIKSAFDEATFVGPEALKLKGEITEVAGLISQFTDKLSTLPRKSPIRAGYLGLHRTGELLGMYIRQMNKDYEEHKSTLEEAGKNINDLKEKLVAMESTNTKGGGGKKRKSKKRKTKKRKYYKNRSYRKNKKVPSGRTKLISRKTKRRSR